MNWENYSIKLKELGYAEKDISDIKPAFEFAKETHKNEKRLSGEPYFLHPVAVSLYVAKLKLDSGAVKAALLHDVIENQKIKIEKIKKEFGEETAFLVEALTKADTVKYKGIEREVESLRKMFLSFAKDIRVVIIKLMDRLHNMETLNFQKKEKQNRIATETLELYAPLADRLGMWELKARLEDLAFPYIHKEEFFWVQEQIKDKRKNGEEFLEKLKPELEHELKKENIIPQKITYRTKHLYSIWKKLLKYEMDFNRILDIVAMRIVVNSVADCYQTLGIIHKLWKPMPGRIKDFIALPKPNGYQSLHTTVFGPEKKIVDFQIRTNQMDKEAEFGIAAHWSYEEQGKKFATQKGGGKKFEWISQLQEWYNDHKNSTKKDALNALKIDFFKDRIFVLTPKGDVIDLPEGATPIDFAYHIHSEVGNHMLGAKVNGKMVSFNHILKSGENVEILTQKNKEPTMDWLENTKSSLAKNRIRAFLRNNGKLKQIEKKQKMIEISITVEDRVGLLKECSEVFANLKINLLELKTDFKNKSYPKIIFYFAEKNNINMGKIKIMLKKIKGVQNVAAQSYLK